MYKWLVTPLLLINVAAHANENDASLSSAYSAIELHKQYTQERWVAVSQLDNEISATDEIWTNLVVYDATGKNYTSLVKLDKSYIKSLSKNESMSQFLVKIKKELNGRITLLNK